MVPASALAACLGLLLWPPASTALPEKGGGAPCGKAAPSCDAEDFEDLSALQVRGDLRATAKHEERREGATAEAEGFAQSVDTRGLAMQAYIYGYPLTEMYKSRYSSIQGGNNVNALYRADVNEVNCTFTAVVTPNVDTAYTSSFVELSKGPMVLTVPAFPSNYYWMVQFMDAFTNSFAYAGSLISGENQTTFVVTGPGYTHDDFCGDGAPKPVLCAREVTWFKSTTPVIWLLARYLNTGDVTAYQQATKLTSFADYEEEDVVDGVGFVGAYPPYDETDAVAYFQTLNTALMEWENLTARPHDVSLLADVARAGIGNTQSLNMVEAEMRVASLSSVASDLEYAKKVATAYIAASGKYFTTVNGWLLLPSFVGNYGNDYLARAAIAKYGFGANAEQYAMYDYADTDSQNRSLYGVAKYTLTFPSAPPTKSVGFWSVTAYVYKTKSLSCNGESYANGQARYSINSLTNLASSHNGSFTLYLQAHQPTGAVRYQNWLPVPSQQFYVILRVYNPDDSVVSRVWLPQGIQRASPASGTPASSRVDTTRSALAGRALSQRAAA